MIFGCTVPDFRSKTGLFNNVQEHHPIKASGKHLFDASVYRTDAATSMFHDMVRSLARLAEASKPTAFHQLLAKVAEEGRLLRLYSQNVDGLDIALPPLATTVPLNAKAPWPRTIQLHGGLGKMVCQKCGHLADFEAALFEGPRPPPCRNCVELDSLRTTVAGKRSHGVGRLRPRIVLYNEHNPDEEAIGAVTRCDLRSRPDALVVVGTSLRVRGVRRIVKEMCRVVRGRRDGVTVWINNGFRPVGRDFDGCWDLVVNGAADVVASLAGWPAREPSESNAGEEVDDDDWAEMKGRDSPVVVVTSPKKPKPRKDQIRGEGAVPAMGKLGSPKKNSSSSSSTTLKPDENDAPSPIKLVLRPPMEPIRGTKQPKQEPGGGAKEPVPGTKQQKKEAGSNAKKPVAGAKQSKKEASKEAGGDAKKPVKMRKPSIMKAQPTIPSSSTKISAVFKTSKARSDSATAAKQKAVNSPLST
jgi:NAD-dependent histone deacetylase SIR2